MTKPEQAPASAASEVGEDARLPHDRDEAAQPPTENAQHEHNRQPIHRAKVDVESGIQDTERIGTPNDVPSAARNQR